MPETCLIEAALGQTRSALAGADDLPIEVDFHASHTSVVPGSVVAGRVTRVSPQLDMAFVALPEGREGALSFRRAKALGGKDASSISDCVTEGQLIRVQVVSDPSGLEDKALTLTARPKIVGRYLVAEWGNPRLNFSKDIGPRPKKRLQESLSPWGEKLALLVRSRAAAIDPVAIAAEAEWLAAAFAPLPKEPAVLLAPTPVERVLMALGDDIEAIVTESSDVLNDVRKLSGSRWKDLDGKARQHKGEPLFEAYGVEEAIEEALAERIHLPSGGWISIFETPALTAIDVNMGGALAGRSAGEAQKLVNLEAALAIFFHLRFQDIGGLIVVDFIDMKAKGAIADLTRLLDDLIAEDPVPVRRTGVSPLGLVELARSRSGISLRQRFLTRPVTWPEAEAAALALLAKAERIGRSGEAGELLIRSTPDVMTWLQDNDHLLDELEKRTHRTLALEAGRITETAIRKA